MLLATISQGTPPQAGRSHSIHPSVALLEKLSTYCLCRLTFLPFCIIYYACSAEDTYVPARGKAVVKTDLAIAVPAGTYARVAPRSGLAVKHFIDTGAGVIDEDYRGNVGVVLFNHGEADFQGRFSERWKRYEKND